MLAGRCIHFFLVHDELQVNHEATKRHIRAKPRGYATLRTCIGRGTHKDSRAMLEDLNVARVHRARAANAAQDATDARQGNNVV